MCQHEVKREFDIHHAHFKNKFKYLAPLVPVLRISKI